MKKIFTIQGTDLASRKTGAALRIKIEEVLIQDECVELDFSNVLSASESYADEVFGVFIDYYGLDWVLSKIKVSNARSEVTRSIAYAVRRRLEETGLINSSLLVAREALKRKVSRSGC